MQLPERKAWITAKFEEQFGQPPALWVRAPGRVDLMGSHTDYNQGYVMTMTIDGDTWIASRPRADREVHLRSLNLGDGCQFSLDAIDHDPQTPWTNYVRGIAWALQADGKLLTGCDCLIHSTVPIGSGLSSSAALEMASAITFQQLGHFMLEPVQIALLGQKAENSFVGVNTGILDQYSSMMGEECCALLLDCRNLTSQALPLPRRLKVVICDTRAKRNLAGTEYGERRAQCEEGVRILKQFYPQIQALRDVSPEMLMAHRTDLSEVVAKRCQFIVEEDQRVLEMAQALRNRDIPRLGELFYASFAGARDLYQISAPSMEAMMAAMMAGPGVVGARQAGAGFGGCMAALVPDESVPAFSDYVREEYQRLTGIAPQIYPVEASAGAGLVAM